MSQNGLIHAIIDETRRSIIDAILAMGCMKGDKQYHEFAKLVCPTLSNATISEIARHMDRFDDWPESYLLDTIIDYLGLSDAEFLFFLEQYVNPNIHHWRWNTEDNTTEDIPNTELACTINRYLEHDGYKLVVKDTIGDKLFYRGESMRIGVQGSVKNIIFAAKYKPEIAQCQKVSTKSNHFSLPSARMGLLNRRLMPGNVVSKSEMRLFLRIVCTFVYC